MSIYSHGNDQSRTCFFLSCSLYRLFGYFNFFYPCQILLSSCDADWGWRAIIGSIIEWIYFTPFAEQMFVLPRGPVCWDPFSITIGRNYCNLFLCPTFLSLRLKVSISWICSNSPSFSQILSQEHVWTLRGMKRYLVLSSFLCPITVRPMTICRIQIFSWNLRTTLHIKVTVSYCYYHKSVNH